MSDQVEIAEFYQHILVKYPDNPFRAIQRLADIYNKTESEIMSMLNSGIQEAQMYNEDDHPRNPDGTWADKNGDQGYPKEQGLKTDNIQVPKTLSTNELKAQYYNTQYERFKQYDESPDGWPPEPIHPYSDAPDNNQIATAYNVLRDYPEMDEQETIKQAWYADQVRAKHEKIETESRQKLIDGLPNMRVSGRVKSRRGIIEKMGRKKKYKDANSLGDTSGQRVITKDLGESLQAAQFISENFDVIKIDDYTNSLDNRQFKIEQSAPLAGYRAIQFDIRNADGTTSEIQVKTPNQDTWATFFHDNLYKMKEKGANAAEINEHMVEMQMYAAVTSEYFYQIDSGNLAAIPPDCPPRIKRLLGCVT